MAVSEWSDPQKAQAYQRQALCLCRGTWRVRKARVRIHCVTVLVACVGSDAQIHSASDAAFDDAVRIRASAPPPQQPLPVPDTPGPPADIFNAPAAKAESSSAGEKSVNPCLAKNTDCALKEVASHGQRGLRLGFIGGNTGTLWRRIPDMRLYLVCLTFGVGMVFYGFYALFTLHAPGNVDADSRASRGQGNHGSQTSCELSQCIQAESSTFVLGADSHAEKTPGEATAGPDEAACAICLMPMCAGDVVRIIHRCSHAFHRPCIDRWLLTRRACCPLCNYRLSF